VIEITHIVVYGYRITAVFDLMSNMFHYKEDFQMPDKLRLFAVLTDTQLMMRFLLTDWKSWIYTGTYALSGSLAYIFSIRRSMFRILDGWELRTSCHQWLSESVAQYRLSIYHSSRDIQSLTAILLLSMFPDLRNNLKRSGSSLCECSIGYDTLKCSFAPRIQTTPSAVVSIMQIKWYA
jgi:hypothetical protein